MSGDSNDTDDYVPSGVTLIDTDADTDVDAFSLALYSRIYDIVDPDDPVDETDSNASRELTQSSPEQQEPSPQPSTNQLPPTFVSRIRQQLQTSCPAPTADTPSSQSPPSPTSFLDIAEVQLQEYYDRVLTDEALCDASVFRELTPEQLENAFCKRYGQGLSDVEEQVKKLVRDAIADYQVYFEAEKDILEAAWGAFFYAAIDIMRNIWHSLCLLRYALKQYRDDANLFLAMDKARINASVKF